MSNLQSTSRARWSGALIALLTIVLVWLFVRELDGAALRRAFMTADLRFVGLAVLTTLQTYVIRAWRWQRMLRPLGRVHFSPAFRTTVIGFFPFPARAGEFIRPYLLARQEKLNFSATFATIILERALDLTAVLLLFAAAIPFLAIDIGPELPAAGIAAAVAALIGLGALFTFAGHPERLGQWVDRLSRWLPARAAAAVGAFARKFAEGLAVMRNPQALFVLLAWSLALWVSICLGIWLVSHAFGLTVPFAGTFLVVMYLVVGVAAPTPGGAGGFHYMYLLAVTNHFGANADVAAATAILLHLVSFGPVIVLGLLFMWQDGVTLGGVQKIREAQDPANADKDVT